MKKTLQQIKDEVAIKDNFHNWDHLFESCAMYDYGRLEKAIEEVAIRYAQEQNKELQKWKESMMTIHNELYLQGIGEVLGLKLGSSIAPQVLPKIKELVEQNKELVKMLEQCEQWISNCNQYAPILKVIESLINKHKGGKSLVM